MSLDKKFEKLILNVSSKAALSSYYFVGKKDKILADKAAVDTMRTELNKIDMKGQIVIGEGELDEAPMLYIGEKLGTNNGPALDIAVDPLEGTNFAANNLPGALSVIAISEKSNLFNAPETYMNKISADVKEKNVIDLDYSVKKNIDNLSQYKNKRPDDVIGTIPIDSIYNPITNVSWNVQPIPTSNEGHERLILEVTSDGSTTPKDALNHAAMITRQQLAYFMFNDSSAISAVNEEEINEALEIKSTHLYPSGLYFLSNHCFQISLLNQSDRKNNFGCLAPLF